MSIDSADSAYDRLIQLLNESHVRYELIEHAPEGRTDKASALRGHPLAQAAKCMVVGVKMPHERVAHNVLVVIPGTTRVDLDAVCGIAGGEHAGLAAKQVAEDLTGCQSGAIVPLWLRETGADVIADPWLIAEPMLYFNAARLDRSIALRTADYLCLAQPRLEPIAAAADDR